MLLQRFIDRYKMTRKRAYLDMPANYRYGYAFVGAGQHSFSNLYPVIHYLGTPLKTICTLHAEHAVKMACRFPQCTGTGNLEDILRDEQIKGVFVSASPSQHFQLVDQLLSAGKSVFVEKPPCYTLEELKKLASHPRSQYCLVGLQKRFSTINNLLRPYISEIVDYNYQYLTGAYPEGDPAIELFIHPIDNMVQLCGPVEQVDIRGSKNKKTWFIHLTHTSKVTGVVQVSVDHSWKMPTDHLFINTSREILSAHYPNSLTSTVKPPSYFNIPLEKISKSPVTKKVLFDNNHFVPTVPNNNIAAQGFLGEIEYFLKMTEEQKHEPSQHVQSLVPVYEIIEKLREQY